MAQADTAPTPTLCTADEAITLLRSAPRNARFAVNVRLDAPYLKIPEAVFPGALKHHVSFSRAEAVRLIFGLRDAHLESLGGRIPMLVKPINGGPALCYWIGA